MTANADYDQTTIYANGAGEELTFPQIAMAAAKDPGVTVEETAEGYQVTGDLFTPTDE
jgi:hypothetical protein